LEVEKSNGYSGLTLCKIGPDKQLYFLKGVAIQTSNYDWDNVYFRREKQNLLQNLQSELTLNK